MSPTAVTAIIFTIHHSSIAISLILAAAISAIGYFIFLRKQHHRYALFFILFLIALIGGIYVAEDIFGRHPISVELVQAG